MHRGNPGLLFFLISAHHLSLNCYDSTITPFYGRSTINCRLKGTNVDLKADARRFAPAPLIPAHAFCNQDNQSLSFSRVIEIYTATLFLRIRSPNSYLILGSHVWPDLQPRLEHKQ
jgi:hypothetical protein